MFTNIMSNKMIFIISFIFNFNCETYRNNSKIRKKF